MNTPPLSSAARELERYILEGIPLARAMGLRMLHQDTRHMLLGAPLAANVNDKGCAFGGSLSSLMTLCGWALIEMMLREHGARCDVFVANSEVRYLQPVWEDLEAEARLCAGTERVRFLRTLDQRGKARAQVSCTIAGADGTAAASMDARFVAKLRTDGTLAAQ